MIPGAQASSAHSITEWLKLAIPGGCFECVVQIQYFTSVQYQTDIMKHQSKKSGDFGEWQVTNEIMTTVL